MEKVVVGLLDKVNPGTPGSLEMLNEGSGRRTYLFSDEYPHTNAFNLIGDNVIVWLKDNRVTDIQKK